MDIAAMLKSMTNSFGSSSMRELLDEVAVRGSVRETTKKMAMFNLSAYKPERLVPKETGTEQEPFASYAPARAPDAGVRELEKEAPFSPDPNEALSFVQPQSGRRYPSSFTADADETAALHDALSAQDTIPVDISV